MRNVTFHDLIFLAAPAAASVLLNNAFKVIDQYSVQWLGMEAQAAIGSCTFVLLALFSVYSVIASGTGPLVARATGAGDSAFRNQVIGNALSSSLVLGSCALLLCGLAAPWICSGLGLEDNTREQAISYLQWLAIFGFPLVLAPAIDAIFISTGHARLVMILQLLATGLNFILNPLFIYTLDMGICGAALATGMSRGLSVVISLVYLWREFSPQPGDFFGHATLRRIIHIGLPISWGVALYAGVYLALLRFVISPIGPTVNAALGIGVTALEGFTWPVFWGCAIAVASLIGRYLGAKRLDQAIQTIRLAFPLFTTLGLIASLVFWFGAEPFCRIFSNDAAVLAEAILYARILAFSQLFLAYECLAEGILEGSGHTRPIFLWSAPLNFLRVPLAWFCAIHLGYGAMAVWWVITITTILKSAGKWATIKHGHWQSIHI